MNLIVEALALGTLLTYVALILATGVYALRKLGYSFERLNSVERFMSSHSRKIVLGFASLATLGSLYMSNFLGYDPCRLCWFQRIFMYPLVLLSGTSIFLDKSDLRDYALPLVIVGVPIAFIHGIVQRFDQFSSAGCSVTSISCSTEYTFHYGFITIPFMALAAFLAIGLVLWKFED